MYAFKQIAEHKLSLDDSVTVEGKNVVPTELVTDELPALSEGNYVTISRLLNQMITQSDNTAFNALLDALDRQTITNYIHSIGLTHSVVGSKLNLDTSQEQYEFDANGYGINTTTAEDYTKAFELIKNNKIPGAKLLLGVLKQQKINYMLPLLLPKDVVVAHKHGDLDPLYHDGGIVYGPKGPYIVSIFSNAGDPSLIAQLSKLIYTKDYSLVGSSSQKTQDNNVAGENPSIDPLVAEGKLPFSVLGAKTQPIQTQPITAADLGITANDLSLTINAKKLPKVIIPPDSPLHFLVPAMQIMQKAVTLDPKTRVRMDAENLSLHLAEAKYEKDKGNLQLSHAILNEIQAKLNSISKNKALSQNPQAQTQLQAVSETRFSFYATDFKKADIATKKQLIKEVAKQAKDTLTNVQPNTPQALNATNPSQRPLVGEIIQKNDRSVTIRTSSGQAVNIPTDTSVGLKSKDLSGKTQVTAQASLSSLAVGATVALVGSSKGDTFVPSFAVTGLPKEIIAPQPAVVLKVNTKNNTMVIAENGIPVQVNLTKQTRIVSSDTNIPLSSIKKDEQVIVIGKPVIPETPTPTAKLTVQPTTGQNQQTKSGQPQKTTSPTPTQGKKTTPSINSTSVNLPTPQQPQAAQPKVIQGTSIQVVANQASSRPSTPSKPTAQTPNNNTKSQPQQPAAPPPKTAQPEEVKKGK